MYSSKRKAFQQAIAMGFERSKVISALKSLDFDQSKFEIFFEKLIDKIAEQENEEISEGENENESEGEQFSEQEDEEMYSRTRSQQLQQSQQQPNQLQQPQQLKQLQQYKQSLHQSQQLKQLQQSQQLNQLQQSQQQLNQLQQSQQQLKQLQQYKQSLHQSQQLNQLQQSQQLNQLQQSQQLNQLQQSQQQLKQKLQQLRQRKQQLEQYRQLKQVQQSQSRELLQDEEDMPCNTLKRLDLDMNRSEIRSLNEDEEAFQPQDKSPRIVREESVTKTTTTKVSGKIKNLDSSTSGTREEDLCKICFDQRANVVLIPCGHFAFLNGGQEPSRPALNLSFVFISCLFFHVGVSYWFHVGYY